jgi:hypothetical protein
VYGVALFVHKCMKIADAAAVAAARQQPRWGWVLICNNNNNNLPMRESKACSYQLWANESIADITTNKISKLLWNPVTWHCLPKLRDAQLLQSGLRSMTGEIVWLSERPQTTRVFRALSLPLGMIREVLNARSGGVKMSNCG